ncbi:MAG: two-component system phosphate regulon sensor histidine kinase PhoR [Marinoscillum sp.]
MKNTPIRFLVALGSLSMIAILVVQIYWVMQAIDREEEQFNHSVQMAMRNVVESLCQINGNDIPSNDPIDQLSSNYFIARTNYKIDLASLDYLLKAELQKRNIEQDYEYGVYDCQTDQMVYGDFVSFQEVIGQVQPLGKLPKLVNDEYYFGIYFPGKTMGLVSNLGLWQVTSVLTLLIMIFFSYALFVILRQRRLSEIQRDFINNMTHEFKTPLATLQVSTEVLKKEATNERQRRYAEIMGQELSRLEKHVHQLLETSVADQPRKLLKLNAWESIAGCVKDFENVNGQVIKTDIDELSTQIQFIGHQSLMQTILFNLLDNATKYGTGAVSLNVSVLKSKLHLKVSNEGPEIPQKDLKKIFDKFYRVNQGDTHDVKGFGLGLYLLKEAAAKMRGTATASCADGITSFHLILPTANE